MKYIFPAVILLFYSIVSLFFGWNDSLTFDERVNIEEGIRNITYRSYDIEPYNPPLIRELAAIPLTLKGYTSGIPLPAKIDIFYSRMVIIIMGGVLLALVMLTGKRIAGYWAGIAAGVLLLFDPSFLAHAHYITPDTGSALFYFLSWMLFLYAWKKKTSVHWLFAGIAFGCTAASKIPAAFLFLLTAALYSVFSLQTRLKYSLKEIVSFFLVSGIVSLFVIWSVYGFTFKEIIQENQNTDRVSDRIIAFSREHNIPLIERTITFLKTTPVPLGSYLGKIKNTIIRSTKQRYDFVWDDVKEGKWYFLPLVYAKKTPLPIFIFLIIGSIVLARTYKKIRKEYLFIVVPLVVIFCGSFLLNTPPLVRYLLAASPFVSLAGAVTAVFLWKTTIGKCIVVVLFSWYMVGTVRTFPYPITFANEFVLQPYKELHDSNIDWGQGLNGLHNYIQNKQPGILFFSYFGRDDAGRYGFESQEMWGSYKNDDICRFHTIEYPYFTNTYLTVISVTNWRNCGYDKMPQYSEERILDVVSSVFLVF